MIRCAVLHEFIYHTVHKMDFNQNAPSLYDRFPLNCYLPANTECTPIEELPKIDDDPDSPFRHVVRIPPFKDAQRGWFMVRDVLQVSFNLLDCLKCLLRLGDAAVDLCFVGQAK
jgi:hypothetical protein